ncbi:hypothetical protein Adt_04300 [Abeliophyllum distichum]|uniref:Uncharacterized protein n=1 Tax=Abeliophyllum distichum TaxID=126358 RepID=A0ABD1W195_9LAMI
MPQQWPDSNTVKHSELNARLKLFHYILAHNIFPPSHMTLRMQLLYWLAKGHDLNFRALIVNAIIENAPTTGARRRSISRALFRHFGKKMVPSQIEKIKSPTISLTTL